MAPRPVDKEACSRRPTGRPRHPPRSSLSSAPYWQGTQETADRRKRRQTGVKASRTQNKKSASSSFFFFLFLQNLETLSPTPPRRQGQRTTSPSVNPCLRGGTAAQSNSSKIALVTNCLRHPLRAIAGRRLDTRTASPFGSGS